MTSIDTHLEKKLQYFFSDAGHLQTALTHRSLGQHNNERLEYLGDALLGFIIAEALYLRYPDATEGELTRLRATLVKGETLAKLALSLDIGQYVKLGNSELKSGGWRRNSILANTLEAIIGGIYLDGGFAACKTVVLNLYADNLNNSTPQTLVKDPKTQLQEYLQSRQYPLPDYTVIQERGEAHARIFTVECKIPPLSLTVQAEGHSKRRAEQAAAERILESLTHTD